MEAYENEGPDHLVIKKIDNGFVIEACCTDEAQSLFVKNLTKAPSVIARMFKIDDEDRRFIEDSTKIEQSETEEDGKIKLKIKMTK